jgi:glycosyltransferase involved in cell wall biosynthesis
MNPSHSVCLRIVIPAYNEESRIVPTLRDYCDVFKDNARVVVVANGCSDATADAVRDLQREFDNLSLIDIPNAIGKGGAVRVGLSTGDEPFVGFVDADGSTSALEFARLFNALRSSPADALIGSRWLPESEVKPRQRFVRRLASRTFNSIVRVLFGLPLRDTQCGAKLFRRQALRAILASLEVADFAFDIEVLWLLRRAGYEIAEHATVWSDRMGTKIRIVDSSWAMLLSVLRLRLRRSALWSIPFVDYFGRKNVIPVRRSRRMLVLGESADSQSDPHVAALFGCLRRSRVELVDAKEAGLRHVTPFSFLWWYAFRSHRDYDAIVEIPGHRLWILPWLSVKPSFIVESALHPAGDAHRYWYGRSTFVNLDRQEPAAAADLMLTTAYVGALHPTVFVGNDEAFSLHYPDRQTGAPTSNLLQ